jgi:hypothetical protein
MFVFKLLFACYLYLYQHIIKHTTPTSLQATTFGYYPDLSWFSIYYICDLSEYSCHDNWSTLTLGSIQHRYYQIHWTLQQLTAKNMLNSIFKQSHFAGWIARWMISDAVGLPMRMKFSRFLVFQVPIIESRYCWFCSSLSDMVPTSLSESVSL